MISVETNGRDGEEDDENGVDWLTNGGVQSISNPSPRS